MKTVEKTHPFTYESLKASVNKRTEMYLRSAKKLDKGDRLQMHLLFTNLKDAESVHKFCLKKDFETSDIIRVFPYNQMFTHSFMVITPLVTENKIAIRSKIMKNRVLCKIGYMEIFAADHHDKRKILFSTMYEAKQYIRRKRLFECEPFNYYNL